MKQFYICMGLMGLFGLVSTVTAQDVPKKVKEGFANKFPSIEKVEWERESAKEWEAEFKMRGTAHDALFHEDGTWLETGFGIPLDDVPAKLITALKNEFPKWKLSEAEKLSTKEGDAYEFEMERESQEIDVIMDPNGKILKKEIEDDEDDDEMN